MSDLTCTCGGGLFRLEEILSEDGASSLVAQCVRCGRRIEYELGDGDDYWR